MSSSALFVTDCDHHKIRRVVVATGAVTTLAGSGQEGAIRPPEGHCNQPGRQRAVCGGLRQPQDPSGGGGDWRGDYARGQPACGSVDGVGDEAQFNNPLDLAISADGSTLSVCEASCLRQVCVAAPPPPPSFAPLVVPPSTFSAVMKKTRGDASLPHGPVTFLVGDEEERLEHVSKCVICVRSVYFRTMFGIRMKDGASATPPRSRCSKRTSPASPPYLRRRGG